MKIAVLIKQTPDTADLPKVSAEEVSKGQLSVTQIINPWDEFAAEEAINLADRFDGDSFAITLGDGDATDGLKHALAMGINNAVLVDMGSAGRMDSWATAAALAGAIKEIEDVDILLSEMKEEVRKEIVEAALHLASSPEAAGLPGYTGHGSHGSA